MSLLQKRKLKKTAQELLNQNEQLEQRLLELGEEIQQANQTLKHTNYQIDLAKTELNMCSGLINYLEIGGNYQYVDECASELEQKLKSIQERIGTAISNGLFQQTRDYKIDGSSSKGQRFQKYYIDNLTIGLTAYINKKQKSVTTTNYDKTIESIWSTFNKYCEKANIIGATISKTYVQLRAEETKIILDLKMAKEQERKELAEKRRLIKEQEKMLAEAEKERKQLENERKAMDVAFNAALTEEERNEIKQQIEQIDKRIADVDYRCTHQQSGWLYVISSPALPNMVKIGVTKRPNPTIRVKELSSSSLPVPFRAHCFVFSDDCFALETAVHKRFNDKRVNQDREFFYLTAQEAIEVLKNEFNCEIHFEDIEENT